MPASDPSPTQAPDLSSNLERQRLLQRLASVPLMTLFIIICSQVAIPTAPLGIPITLQTLGVLLCAMALGPRMGFASITLYLFMDLIGFLFCQPVAHALIKRPDGSVRGWLALFGAGIAVHMVIFFFGVPWLHWIRTIDTQSEPLTWAESIKYGFLVFIPGMLLKSGIAAVLGAWLLPGVARRMW